MGWRRLRNFSRTWQSRNGLHDGTWKSLLANAQDTAHGLQSSKLTTSTQKIHLPITESNSVKAFMQCGLVLKKSNNVIRYIENREKVALKTV